MIKKETFIYDENLDRIMVFNDLNKDEKVDGSVRISNLILDITNKNKIANIEIRNVSEYLKYIDIDPSILNYLTEAKVIIKQIFGGFLLTILLKHNNQIEKMHFNIPTEEEISITA